MGQGYHQGEVSVESEDRFSLGLGLGSKVELPLR